MLPIGAVIQGSSDEAQEDRLAEKEARRALFKKLDLDSNGQLSREEWERAFDAIDANGDGSISRKEWFLHHGTALLFDSIKRKRLAMVTRAEWTQAFDAFDRDTDDGVSLEEFLGEARRTTSDATVRQELHAGEKGTDCANKALPPQLYETSERDQDVFVDPSKVDLSRFEMLVKRLELSADRILPVLTGSGAPARRAANGTSSDKVDLKAFDDLVSRIERAASKLGR